MAHKEHGHRIFAILKVTSAGPFPARHGGDLNSAVKVSNQRCNPSQFPKRISYSDTLSSLANLSLFSVSHACF